MQCDAENVFHEPVGSVLSILGCFVGIESVRSVEYVTQLMECDGDEFLSG